MFKLEIHMAMIGQDLKCGVIKALSMNANSVDVATLCTQHRKELWYDGSIDNNAICFDLI